MEWFDSKFLWSLVCSIFAGGTAYGWAKRDRQALQKDVAMNDVRLRKEVSQQLERDKESFSLIREDIKLLENHRQNDHARSIRIESDGEHTRKKVDEMNEHLVKMRDSLASIAASLKYTNNE